MFSNLLRSLKRKKSNRIGLGTSASFRYKVGYRRNGINYYDRDFVPNLILDSGLNKVATVAWADCWATCLFGNQVSPTPVRRDSVGVTFTTVGTACTASGSFFVSSDVGRLIKFNDTGGQEFYITAFTSATLVTLGGAPSPAIAGVNATIWYVNETTLDSLFDTTATYQQNSGDNQTTVSANVVTYKRTFVGNAVVSPVTLTEIGFNNSSSNANLFDRDIITGGISLSAGDQPICTAELILTVNPNSSTSVGNVATGFDSSGNMIISGMDMNNNFGGLSWVETTGGTTASSVHNKLEPSFTSIISAITATFSMPSFSNGAGPSFTQVQAPTNVQQSYSSGNFFIDSISTFSVSDANGSIFGYAMVEGSSGLALWTQKFTASFTKLSTQVLTVTFRKSWQRILAN